MRILGVVGVLGLGLGLALAGCGGSGDSGASLSSVKVTGAADEKPTVTFDAPFSVTKTSRKVLTTGDGAKVAEGKKIVIDYVAVNGADGKEFDTSYGSGTASLTLDSERVIPGFLKGLDGTTVGSRVLIAIAPKDGYGPQGGIKDAGIGKDDTLVFVVDIRSVRTSLAKATGTPVAPVAGQPTVTVDAKGKPTITLPAGPAPTNLVVQPLIVGTGAPVTAGQSLTVHYTGIIWPGGKQFDSSWDRGAPADFSIGKGAVITGWDEGLVGQNVGSQVLLVIPPDKGYGAQGNSAAGIAGTDTLVFVVDILDAS